MPLGQIVALVMVNKCVRFHGCTFNNEEVMAKVKVFQIRKGALFCQKSQSYAPYSGCSPCDGKQVCEVSLIKLQYQRSYDQGQFFTPPTTTMTTTTPGSSHYLDFFPPKNRQAKNEVIAKLEASKAYANNNNFLTLKINCLTQDCRNYI